MGFKGGGRREMVGRGGEIGDAVEEVPGLRGGGGLRVSLSYEVLTIRYEGRRKLLLG